MSKKKSDQVDLVAFLMGFSLLFKRRLIHCLVKPLQFDLFSDFGGHQRRYGHSTNISHFGITKIKVGRKSTHSAVFRVVDIAFFIPINTLTRAGQSRCYSVIIKDLRREKSINGL